MPKTLTWTPDEGERYLSGKKLKITAQVESDARNEMLI
jgi:hypothetical protein